MIVVLGVVLAAVMAKAVADLVAGYATQAQTIDAVVAPVGD